MSCETRKDFSKFTERNTFDRIYFNKVADLFAVTFQQRFFPPSFAKYLRTLFYRRDAKTASNRTTQRKRDRENMDFIFEIIFDIK